MIPFARVPLAVSCFHPSFDDDDDRGRRHRDDGGERGRSLCSRRRLAPRRIFRVAAALALFSRCCRRNRCSCRIHPPVGIVALWVSSVNPSLFLPHQG